MDELKYKIAEELIHRVKGEKFPYRNLEWLTRTIYADLHGYGDIAWEAYFIAVNTLKLQGIKNAKRGSLTKLSKKEREVFRAATKEFASLLQKYVNCKIEVSSSPIRVYRKDKEPSIQVLIHWSKSGCSCLYPSYSEMIYFSGLDIDDKVLKIWNLAQRLTGKCEDISDNKEIITANLEELFEKSNPSSSL